jgi:hypothetical protein
MFKTRLGLTGLYRRAQPGTEIAGTPGVEPPVSADAPSE